MPETDSYLQGTPCWVDLTTTDQAGADVFYITVFGWNDQDNLVQDDVFYTMALIDGRNVAAISPMSALQAEELPPNWSIYLAVDDVDDSTAKVIQAGGTVIAPSFDVMDAGRMAVIADPTGASVSLWQARDHIGPSLHDEPGTLTWNECFTDDIETAAAFYDAVLGTSHSSSDASGAEAYTTLDDAVAALPGISSMTPRPMAGCPTCGSSTSPAPTSRAPSRRSPKAEAQYSTVRSTPRSAKSLWPRTPSVPFSRWSNPRDNSSRHRLPGSRPDGSPSLVWRHAARYGLILRRDRSGTRHRNRDWRHRRLDHPGGYASRYLNSGRTDVRL